MLKILPAWMQDLALLVERVEAIRPPTLAADWEPGVTLRMPFNRRLCTDDKFICSQAMMALADAAMVLACAAAWNGYRAMGAIDQTTHFLRPVGVDVIADARIVRIGRTTSFGHITLFAAHDKRPAGMVTSAYAML